MRNARQILDIVTASFSGSSSVGRNPSLDCVRPSSGAEELACEWQQISKIIETASSGGNPGEDQIMDVSKVRDLTH